MFRQLSSDKDVIRRFLAVCITSELIYYVHIVKSILYTPYREMLGLSAAQLGTVLSVMGWVATIGGIAGAWVHNRFPARILQTINLIVSGITCFYMISGAVTYSGMLAVGVIWGFSIEAFYWSAVTKTVRLMFPDDKQSRAFGLFEALRGATDLIAFPLFLILFAVIPDSLHSMRIIMGLVGTALVLSGICIYRILPGGEILPGASVAGRNREAWDAMVRCLKIPQLWLCGLMGMGVYATYIGISYFQPFMENVFALPTVAVSAFSLLSTSALRPFCGTAAGVLADRKFHGAAPLMRALFGIGILTLLVTFLIPKTRTTMIPVLILLVLISIIIFLLRGVYYAPVGESGIPVECTGSAMAIVTLLIQFPLCWADAVYGTLIDRAGKNAGGYDRIFLIMIICLGISLLAAMLLLKISGAKTDD